MTQRNIDKFGFVLIEKNPITKAGVFDYVGKELPKYLNCDPDTIYKVYRPEEELTRPETLASLNLIPIEIGHTPVGLGMDDALDVGVVGYTGESCGYDDGTGVLWSNIKLISQKLMDVIASGCKEVSAGYTSELERASDAAYDFIQRNIIFNHIAIVENGRAGSDVMILDTAQFLNKSEVLNVENEETKEISMQDMCNMMDALCQRIDALESSMVKDAESEEEKDDDDMTKDAESEEEKDDDDDKKQSYVAQDEAAIVKRVTETLAARTELAKRLQPHVGVINETMFTDANEVAKYAIKKLSIKAEGDSLSVLNGWLSAQNVAVLPVQNKKISLEDFK